MRIKLFGKLVYERTNETEEQPAQPQAFLGGGGYNRVFVMPYTGEKDLGELGPIRKYAIDHEALRLRSWQLYLESEICQTVIKRFARWVIGNGLKLQAEPQKEVLESEKITIDTEDFNKVTESRFKVFANSTMCDYTGERNLHVIAQECFINSKVGGDALVVLRYINNVVKVQLIDGAHVSTPLNLSFNGIDFVTETGVRVKNGEELSSNNQVIAYWVRTGNALSMTWERIPARGAKSGALMAFMVKGLRYRLDNNRAIPLLSAVMETVKKMERYKEATIGSAEERQKIPYTIEHESFSTGENPMLDRALKATGRGAADDIPRTDAGRAIANQVAVSTNKSVTNLPIGAKLVSLEADNELYFKDFYTVNIDLVCATVDIPPNVAMSKYESNFSASRAALKDWEHTLNVERKAFADQFYAPIYWFWLETQILTNKIQAPGYLTALGDKNTMALEAYRYARFVGANVPHIDPEKEVRAERLKLGDAGQTAPLTTVEAATEAVNGGDYSSNVKQFGRELEEQEAAGIESPESLVQPVDNAETKDK